MVKHVEWMPPHRLPSGSCLVPFSCQFWSFAWRIAEIFSGGSKNGGTLNDATLPGTLLQRVPSWLQTLRAWQIVRWRTCTLQGFFTAVFHLFRSWGICSLWGNVSRASIFKVEFWMLSHFFWQERGRYVYLWWDCFTEVAAGATSTSYFILFHHSNVTSSNKSKW